MVVSSEEELEEKLRGYVEGERGVEGVYEGGVKGNREAMAVFRGDEDLRATVGKWVGSGKVKKVVELWVRGLEVEWEKLYGEAKPRRMSLPTYPFAGERYWVEGVGGEVGVGVGNRGERGERGVGRYLHPMLHENRSDLREQRYRTRLRGEEFFLADHRVEMREGGGEEGEKVLPGVAMLEMAREAVERSWPGEEGEEGKGEEGKGVGGKGEGGVVGKELELREVVWVQPVVVRGEKELWVRLRAAEGNEGREGGEEIEYEIYGEEEGGEEVVYSQGRGVWRERREERVEGGGGGEEVGGGGEDEKWGEGGVGGRGKWGGDVRGVCGDGDEVWGEDEGSEEVASGERRGMGGTAGGGGKGGEKGRERVCDAPEFAGRGSAGGIGAGLGAEAAAASAVRGGEAEGGEGKWRSEVCVGEVRGGWEWPREWEWRSRGEAGYRCVR